MLKKNHSVEIIKQLQQSNISDNSNNLKYIQKTSLPQLKNKIQNKILSENIYRLQGMLSNKNNQEVQKLNTINFQNTLQNQIDEFIAKRNQQMNHRIKKYHEDQSQQDIKQFLQLLHYFYSLQHVIPKQQLIYIEKPLNIEISRTKNAEIIKILWQNSYQSKNGGYTNIKIQQVLNKSSYLLKQMNFIASMSRKYLVQYKSNRWKYLQKDIHRHKKSLSEIVGKLATRMIKGEDIKTKNTIINSLSKMSPICLAQNYRYHDWNQRALEKLRQKTIKCDVLKYQVISIQ